MKSKVENGEVIEEYRAKFKHSQFIAHGAIEAFITNALNQQRGELVEKFKEVIGEDEKNLGSHDREGNLDMDDWSIGFRNQLREEQKAKLESF